MARIDLPESTALAAVVAALDGQVRLVGGVVRDTLAGVATKDIDLATPLAPEAVMAALKAAGLKSVPTGLAHGTVTAVAEGRPFEITTLRRDVATDGRHAEVAFTDDWQEDAARRDFTINALYADPATGDVFDYFGGVADLNAGIVRFIGAPLQRIAEDHLRILRFFRFYARFGSDGPDAASLSACQARANDLMALSRERIAMELLALLALPNPAPTLALMIEGGIFVPVLPEVTDAAPVARLVAREAEAGIAPDALRRLSALIGADPALAEDIANRLKLSNAHRKRMIAVAGRVDEDAKAPRALAYWQGVEVAIDRLLLGNGDARLLIDWAPPRFPVTGGAIVARGVQAGPEVARILQAAERQWVAEGFPDGARAEDLIDELIKG
ncbi:MAG: CCA tRNA nucleotidyltransferase [Sphingomonadaceae bacterium]|jgi:poly(A) polymerase|nr:CCA tRNA nucleotidyltransferase [Sphingomonadaceae bacterium]NCA01024.1 CCA tRNA nucleotidyltransferase [Sphingomonadaceae bacterium]